MKINKIKSMILALFAAILLLSGCAERVTDTVLETGDKLKNLFDAGADKISNIPLDDDKLIGGTASLSLIAGETIDTFDSYHKFADRVNVLIKFLNREGGFELQALKGTQEEYEKISKVITEYSPLIDNYNKVIYAARDYNESDPDSVKEYYKALGIFGLELTIIYTTVWYGPAYKGVGMIYRWSGLNRLAFKYPTLISYILSSVHWGLRNLMVDKSSEAAEYLIDKLGKINN